MVDESTKRDPWAVEEDLDEGAEYRRGIPGWLWGCGGGCLALLAISIGLTAWSLKKVADLVGPEAAWPVVAEVMPFGDERPMGYSANLFDLERLTDNRLMRWAIKERNLDEEQGLAMIGHQVILLQEQFDAGKESGDGSMAILWRLPAGQEADEFELPREFTTGNSDPDQEPETLTVQLQGRELEAERTYFDGQSSQFAPGGPQQILEVDLSGDRERGLLLKLVSTGSVVADEDELQRFLEPFDVWGGN